MLEHVKHHVDDLHDELKAQALVIGPMMPYSDKTMFGTLLGVATAVHTHLANTVMSL